MSKLDDLMARIKAQVEVKRTKSGGVVIQSPQILRKEAERLRALAAKRDPGLTAIAHLANKKAAEIHAADPYAGWTEVSKVSLLQDQQCRCCGHSTLYVCGEFVRLVGYTQKPKELPVHGTVLVRRPGANGSLRTEIQYAPVETISACPECLAAGETFDAVLDKVGLRRAAQLRLFS